MKVDIFRTGKKYDVIYADPPWSYRDKALAGNRGAGCKYDVMSLEDICKLPVKELAKDDCVLFMWVTMPKPVLLHGLSRIRKRILFSGVWVDGLELMLSSVCWLPKEILRGRMLGYIVLLSLILRSTVKSPLKQEIGSISS